MTTTETPALPLSERTAADLRVLADLAAAHPGIAAELAPAVAALHLVLDRNAQIAPAAVIDAAVAAGGVEVAPDTADGWFPCRAVDLPSGAVRLIVSWLRVGDLS